MGKQIGTSCEEGFFEFSGRLKYSVMSAKECALRDMVLMGVSVSYLNNAKAIVEFTKTNE